MVRIVKGEPSSSNDNVNGVNKRKNMASDRAERDGKRRNDVAGRRVLRSRYLAVKNLISDKRDDLTKLDSDKFRSIINEVDSLHEHVENPREQVADAEALLDITNTIATSVKAHGNEGVTAGDFVSSILQNFGQLGSGDDVRNSVRWKEIGSAVSHVFLNGDGCCTMLGPMNSEVKKRKAVVQRKQTRPTEKARPEELAASATEEKTDTDKNMATMFKFFTTHRTVKLENLVLNRSSFAQTVENLFVLSFLVKDGRVEIKVNEEGCHLVSPRNAARAKEVVAKKVAYSHFMFRFDYRDWKLMLESVPEGEELMPHRTPGADTSLGSQRTEDETVLPSTPIRKLSRNRGLVLQEQTVVENSPESGDSGSSGGAIRRRKRKFRLET